MMSHANRRQFLSRVAAGIAVASPLVRAAEAEQPSQSPAGPGKALPTQVAILNDTHIGQEHRMGHAHPENLRAAVRALVARKDRLAAVIINGDLAMGIGRPGDYEHFKRLLEPLHEAGLPLHLTLGNHDNRDEFLRAFPEVRSASRLQDHRHNGIIDLPHARLLLLDSLKDTPAAPGRLGEQQIAWMLQEIDARSDKPVVVVAHHNPRLGGDPVHFPGGVEDTEGFWPELVKRSQVKAYVHGHVHNWTLGMHSGIHIINTLASAMVADKSVSTNGWTLASFEDHGVALEIHTYDVAHPWNLERKWLYWRRAL